MEKVIPVVTTLLGLAALFFSMYFGVIQRVAQLGIDSVKSVGALPARSRLDATKVLINVFDLDVRSLNPDQQFELALRTFEKRKQDSRRSFILLLSGGMLFLAFSAIYMSLKVNGNVMIRTALGVDRDRTVAQLNKLGFYQIDQTSFVDVIATRAAIDHSVGDPVDQVRAFEDRLKSMPSIVDLRERAEQEKAPFEKPGSLLRTSVPEGSDQPPRYLAYVKHGSFLANRTISLRVKGRDQNIILYASPGITSDDPIDMHINYAQFSYLIGHRPNGKEAILATPVNVDAVYDPSCPSREGFSIEACRMKPRIAVVELPRH